MVDQASEPPTPRTDDSDEVPQGLIPFLCAQLRSTQYALVEARGEVASLREEVTAKDAANAALAAQVIELVARFNEHEARIAEQDVRIAQQEAWKAEVIARIAEFEAQNAERNAEHKAWKAEINAEIAMSRSLQQEVEDLNNENRELKLKLAKRNKEDESSLVDLTSR
jgi:chromosome segregation ATPase